MRLSNIRSAIATNRERLERIAYGLEHAELTDPERLELETRRAELEDEIELLAARLPPPPEPAKKPATTKTKRSRKGGAKTKKA